MSQPRYSAGHAPDIIPSGMNKPTETGLAETGASRQDATKLSFDQNRPTIPGLGLGFFGKAEPSAAKQASTAEVSKQNCANIAANDSAEEGEITADEFEDLYDAQEPVHVAHQNQPVPEIDNSYVEMSDEERDSSGSYSPFLSAKELDGPRPNVIPLPTRESAAIISPSTAEVQKKPTDIVAEARTQAKDSILRLKAANIGYQDYVNEGIDKGVLDQLFGDLGLEAMWKETASAAPTGVRPPSDKTSDTTSTVSGTKATAEVPLEKSESRKDRIARLLAAKGSKSTKSGAATVIGKVAKSPNMKVNSEKSKLLQQKMEALLKAREEKQRELERQTAMAVSGSPSNQVDISSPSQGARPAGLPSSLQVVAASDQAPQPPILEAGSLPLAKALPTSNSGSGSASESSFQKPFGQTRPFLIDVSDDDDDIDMDMESPELRISVLHAPTSPGKRQLPTPSIAQSPGSINTPPASRQDLEKKIEAMKRKIAEAEAKKRIKLSAPASPAASPRPRAYEIYEAKSSSPDVSASMPHGVASHPPPKVAEAGLVSPGSPKQSRSRAASERLPMLESRRKEQMLRLKALQSQIANIERELKEGLEEEQKLREDLDYISDDDVPMSTGSELVAPRAAPARAYIEPVANVEQGGHGLLNPIDMLSPDQIMTDSSSRSSPEVVGTVSIPSTSQGLVAKDPQPLQDDATEVMPASENDEDVAMDEAESSGEEADDDSDGYEPAEASPYQTGHSSPNVKTSDTAPKLTDRDPATAALSAELLSAGRQDSAPIMERASEREVPESIPAEVNDASTRPSYLAYDSPLRYFHSFRFHPNFNKLVPGGLRSATYSNKIDAKLPLCPDEVAGNECPRGENCHFQHFADMSAPDDQILLQLGAYPKCEESRKQEYIEGLRQLLTDYRNRKVKDFTTLSQGIIEYRAKFHGDASKVLPLGTVAL